MAQLFTGAEITKEITNAQTGPVLAGGEVTIDIPTEDVAPRPSLETAFNLDMR